MTWERDQTVWVIPGDDTKPIVRTEIVKVYDDGSVMTEDGRRWDASGDDANRRRYRDYDIIAEDYDGMAERAAERDQEIRLYGLRADAVTAVGRVTDPAILERALAVLRGAE